VRSPVPRLRRALLACGLLASLSLSQAATAPVRLPRTAIVPAPPRTWEFPDDGVTFDSQFPAARLSACTQLAPGAYAVVSEPENRPINPSPWFAFRVKADRPRRLSIRIDTSTARLRYVPKVSSDGRRWIALPADAFTPGPREEEGTLRVDVGPEPLWIAAQEIVSGEDLDAWSRSLESLPFVTRREIGRSVGGRALHAVDLDATRGVAPPGLVVIVSRQHPPETTGSLALMRFVETLVAESPLARRFRARFTVLLVPLMNPDGVAAGHWRHNLNGVDTNRDWDKFEQPETRAVRDAVLAARATRRLVLHLDFHSTFNDVFYTQPDEKPTDPPGFTKAWLEGIAQRVPTYAIKRTPNAAPTQATSHHWAHREFGIPAITYELGDNTDRVVLQAVATAAADSMMEQLLSLVPEPPAR
jgi:hypothetical protein